MADLDPSAGRGVAVRGYPTVTGPIDYLLMVDGEPVGLVEAKRDVDDRPNGATHDRHNGAG